MRLLERIREAYFKVELYHDEYERLFQKATGASAVEYDRVRVQSSSTDSSYRDIDKMVRAKRLEGEWDEKYGRLLMEADRFVQELPEDMILVVELYFYSGVRPDKARKEYVGKYGDVSMIDFITIINSASEIVEKKRKSFIDSGT